MVYPPVQLLYANKNFFDEFGLWTQKARVGIRDLLYNSRVTAITNTLKQFITLNIICLMFVFILVIIIYFSNCKLPLAS
jgi:hypothetical protein